MSTTKDTENAARMKAALTRLDKARVSDLTVSDLLHVMRFDKLRTVSGYSAPDVDASLDRLEGIATRAGV